MTNYLSEKLRVLSFVLICMVVLLHSQVINLSPKGVSIYIQRFFSGEITRIAVSFFFIISGFLFAYNIDGNNLRETFTLKIKKRIHSLLIPYLLWSAICVTLFLVIQLLLPSSVGSTRAICDFKIMDYYNEIVINPKIAYQLWFIRDLFIVSVFSPIIYLLLKIFKEIIVIGAIALWFNLWHIGFMSVTSITFFTIGLYLAIYRKAWIEYRFVNAWWWLFSIIWVVFCILIVYIDYDSLLILFFDKLLGILTLWITYDLIDEQVRDGLISSDMLSFTFIIYIMHEPFLTLFKHAYIRVIGVDSVLSSLCLYFISPMVIICVCIMIGRYLKNDFPKVYKVMTGGR